MNPIAAFAKFLTLLLTLYPLGVITHELIGHGGVGLLAGGELVHVEILGVVIWPRIEWIGWQGHYGVCGVTGIADPHARAWMSLGGALSTWLASVTATGLLLARRWKRPARWVLACLSLWWIDLFTYTLPSWGIRRSILWGPRSGSEPYEAAMELGLPGPVFQFLAITTSAALLAALLHARKPCRLQR
ncbi:MAG: hypothetical protein HZA51_07390 [Planctomycetes bacterium]|nr:hypothetical protein [Planctomycetota bacterium]